jgi:hypothetical protein
LRQEKRWKKVQPEKLAGSPSTRKRDEVEFLLLQSKYTRVGLLVPRCNCGSAEPEVDRGADLKFEFEFKTKPQSIDRTKHPEHASARSLHVEHDNCPGETAEDRTEEVRGKHRRRRRRQREDPRGR